jgi:hypothetical protein
VLATVSTVSPRWPATAVRGAPSASNVDAHQCRQAQRWGLLLNDLIRHKADDFEWHYVDVDADFQESGYCAPEGARFWVQASESCRRQGDFKGTAHPNYLGQEAYALRLSQTMRHHTFPRGAVVAPVTAPQGPAAPING